MCVTRLCSKHSIKFFYFIYPFNETESLSLLYRFFVVAVVVVLFFSSLYTKNRCLILDYWRVTIQCPCWFWWSNACVFILVSFFFPPPLAFSRRSFEYVIPIIIYRLFERYTVMVFISRMALKWNDLKWNAFSVHSIFHHSAGTYS